MKYCPKCNAQYSDDTLRYCVTDGAALSTNNPSAPTLIMPDKSVMFVYERVKIQEGDYFEFKSKMGPIRITVKEAGQYSFLLGRTSKKSSELGARISVRGIHAHKGADVLLDDDDFLLPLKTDQRDQEDVSVFTFVAIENVVVVFRVYLEHINLHKQAELNIAYLWYSR